MSVSEHEDYITGRVYFGEMTIEKFIYIMIKFVVIICFAGIAFFTEQTETR